MKKVLRSSFIAVGVTMLLIAGCGAESAGTTGSGSLVSVVVQPSGPSLAPNTSLQLQAVGHYEQGALVNLTALASWASADPGVATVSSGGVVTAVSAGSSVITATFEAVSGSTVVTSSELEFITVSPAAPVIAPGTSLAFMAQGTLQNGATQDLTAFVSWASSMEGIATVNSGGLASASPAVTGTTAITAAFGAITGAAALASEPVVSLAVAPASAAIPLGTGQQFTATATLSGGATQDITSFATWTSSVPATATIATAAGARGLAASVGVGTTLIVATFAGVSSGPATLNVNPASLTGLSVVPAASSIAVGQTTQFIAAGSFSDGSSRDVTAEAAWSSGNARVATVGNAPDTKGLASALGVGQTTVQAGFSGITSNPALLTVSAAVVEAITVSPVNPGLIFGANLQLTAEGVLSDGTTRDLTSTAAWSSSDVAVVSVSDAQGSKGFAVAVGTGSAVITAASGGVSGSSTVTVTLF